MIGLESMTEANPNESSTAIFDWANRFHKTFRELKHKGLDIQTLRVFRNLICRDGFSFSLQAGPAHYSEPKAIAEKYDAWEIGYPSEVEPLWLDWQEPGHGPTESVYGWVPVGVVTNVIAKHGGMIAGTVPEGVAPLKGSEND